MSDWVCIDVEEILRETDKALLCLIDGKEVWIPLSQIAPEDRDVKVGDTDVGLSITSWIANEKGLQ